MSQASKQGITSIPQGGIVGDPPGPATPSKFQSPQAGNMALNPMPATVPAHRPSAVQVMAEDNQELICLPFDPDVDRDPRGVYIKVVGKTRQAMDRNQAFRKASTNAHRFGLVGTVEIKNFEAPIVPCQKEPPHECLAEMTGDCWYRQDILVGPPNA